MATSNLKTRILLPRDTAANWDSSSRVLSAGELVLVRDAADETFEVFEGRNGTFHDGVRALKVAAQNVVLSGDAGATAQAAIDALNSKTVNALSGVDASGTGVVTALAAEGGKVKATFADNSGTQSASGTGEGTVAVLTSVTQDSAGKITAVGSAAALSAHQSLSDYYKKSETSSAAEIADALANLDLDGYALSADVDARLAGYAQVGAASDLSSADTLNGAKAYAKDYADAKAAEINDGLSAYGVTVSADAGEGVRTYTVYQGGQSVGAVEVPVEIFLSAGSVETFQNQAAAEAAGVPTAQAEGASYPATFIRLTLNDAGRDVIWINATSLVDTYTAANPAGTAVQVTVSDYKISADVADNSVTMAKLSDSDTFVLDCGGAAAAS